MLFNSYLFIFCFLPIVWVAFHILKALSIRQAEQEYIESKQVEIRQRAKQIECNCLDSKSLESKGLDFNTQASKRLASTHYMNLAKGFLVVASLFFYAYWKLIYLPILLGSILVNYFLAKGILKSLYVRKQISVDFNGGGDKLNSLSHNFTFFGLFSFCTFSPKTFLTLGIIFNLCLLGVFKYTDFFLENFNLFTQLLHLDFSIPLPHILLPLALSFVTFQQIAFLVDCYKQGKDREETQRLESNGDSQATISTHINFLDYCLFITFFPQLIAGPIVHHKEMMPQFYAMSRNSKICDKDLESKQLTGDSKILELESGLCESTQGRALSVRNRSGNEAIADSSPKAESPKKPSIINWEYIAKGLFIFSIGLFKKVVIADSFAKWANAGFSAVESGSILNLFESWATSLSYTFQLYFDFSGYCDMAIGLGLLFGIVLPINFNSPYKALNIAIFWRKWHITLGRFLKEYLYIPLGGNQNLAYKQSRFYVALNNLLTLRNLFIVAFLSGVWHGAGWGFVIWGSLHGLAMVVHRIYMLLYKRLDSKVKDRACSDKAGRLDFKNVYMRFMKSRIYAVLCWILTFNFVNIAWVFFRAENLQGAANLLKGMFGGEFIYTLTNITSSTMETIFCVGFICVVSVCCIGFKNSVYLTQNLTYRYANLSIIFSAILFVYALLTIAGRSYTPQFLYFNF